MDPEEDKFFGLCKCCLHDGCFRSLWVEYNEAGLLQNYGEMLNECFSLQWQKPDNDHLEQICDECVKRALDAYNFRQQLLQNQDRLTGNSKPDVKDEVLDTASGYEITVIVKEDPDAMTEHEAAGDYEDVEYLAEEAIKEELVDDLENTAQIKRKKKRKNGRLPTYKNERKEKLAEDATKVELVDVPENVDKAHIKIKRKKRQLRLYKKYTSDQMIQCLEAVRSGTMTVPEAAAYYGVPRKTVADKIISNKRAELVAPKTNKNESMVNKDKNLFNQVGFDKSPFVNEVKTLLTYTNATPFKKSTRAAFYHCAYCPPDGPVEDPDELRTHTSTQHADERTKNVYDMLRPVWLNEILRVDIENLHCTVCSTALVSWNDMFKHLKEQHDLDFDEAYTRVIPYILTSDLRCALCKESFPSYHLLDFHMNTHYNNYICSECGDTFLSSVRLKKHLHIHETGRYACGECGKVFRLDNYRKKHIELVHKQKQNFPCRYCLEKFIGVYPRHQHVLECHREKVKTITCEFCGKIFDWRPYYVRHVQRTHENKKNHKCSFCPSQFFMKFELQRHEYIHLGSRFQCTECDKDYSSKNALRFHRKTHDALIYNNVKDVVEIN